MATKAQRLAYYAEMLPWAKQVEAAIGIPAEQEVAFWSWETDSGTNSTAKVNNQAGITKGSAGRDFVSGGYAGYNSMQSFVNDRIRILSFKNYGYPAVVAAAKSGKSYEEITKAHNASGWSEADYNIATITQRALEVLGLDPKRQPPETCKTCRRLL